ncbi:hypothetical protein [Pararhodonellum marinum]|uniref:hypothetical protein n=1 Tax=Pararhodonellum marinum TaxID=2755358 RepID=UPI00188EAC19|nr:hypothetical protein [Pararhodonellum marinum]
MLEEKFIINYIKNYEESSAGEIWGFNLALRNRGCDVFEKAGLKEIRSPSVRFNEDNLKSIKIESRIIDWITFEVEGRIYDSENDETLCNDKKMIFMMNVNERKNDEDRTYFIDFK